MAQLALCGQTRNQLSSQNEGDLVLLLEPQLSVDLSKGYSLKFQIQNQQDVIVIGSCKYFSRCTGQRKDGKPCTVPVDTSVGLRCKYHQNPTPETPKQRVLEQPKPVVSSASSESQRTSQTCKPLDSFLEALQQAPKNALSLQSLSAKTSSSFGGFDLTDDDQEKSNIPSRVSIPTPSKIFSRALSAPSKPISISPIVANIATPRTTNSILNASIVASKPLPPPTHESRWKIGSQSALESQRQREKEVLKKARDDSLVAMGNSDHSVLLSISSLQNNSNGPANTQSRKRSRGEIASPSSSISQSEIDDLLNRHSVNEKQAKDEWTDGFVTRLKTLEKREELIHKDEEVTSILVKASHCLTCDRYSENSTGLSLCQQKGHKIVLVSTKKRFFECQGCGRRDFALGGKETATVGPSYPCGFCKQVNWRPCGKNKSGAVVAGSRLTKSAEGRESGLVVSLSSETSRRDRDRITALHSSLDFTAR